MLEAHFNYKQREEQIYQAWEQANCFKAVPGNGKQPYAVMLPPPNVTGSLHMGHALNHTLQDILIRFQRLRGQDVLWQPGTDHAGIATQMVVERLLAREDSISRRSMTREQFIERVWQWKQQSGNQITHQMRRLGMSCDWSRERFTMDDSMSQAVLKVFVQLYNDGLIYRDKRLVNWDPQLETAISDLEVEVIPTKGHIWHIRYPVVGEEGAYIVVATTRPETIFGDMAVAVHPEDARYQAYIGKMLHLPLANRVIPVIADDYVDPEFGSGAVKITPAHDFNDFEVGRRHNLSMLNIMDHKAHLNENVPPEFRGMDRFVARDKVVHELEAKSLLERLDDHQHTVPYGDRSGVVIEPWLTDQWYLNAATLAKPALRSVEKGDVKFVPENWDKTYFEWLRNIQPWCISRQLWWGHRIPAWYGADGHIFVALDEQEAQTQAQQYYNCVGQEVTLRQDEDVLDTWFSSALWPFATLGWPEQTDAVKHYYPGHVLVTGFDIIFFWVARMMMMGLYFMEKPPFQTVYVHALVRDEKGQKMSKSRGNVIDPLEIVSEYGADALRFTMAAMAVPGRDVKMSRPRVEGYRNFSTKLWNAVKFADHHNCLTGEAVSNEQWQNWQLPLNHWISCKLATTGEQVVKALGQYRFDEAANCLYHFIWHNFCDWYIELSKPFLIGDDDIIKAEISNCLQQVLMAICRMLHPFMPFITEEIWQKALKQPGFLMSDSWPTVILPETYRSGEQALDQIIHLIQQVRSVRSLVNMPAGSFLPLSVCAPSAYQELLAESGMLVQRLARVSEITVHPETADLPKGSVPFIVSPNVTASLQVGDVIDIAQEGKRLQSEKKKLQGILTGLEKRLANPGFVANASADVIAQTQKDAADNHTAIKRIEIILGSFGL